MTECIRMVHFLNFIHAATRIGLGSEEERSQVESPKFESRNRLILLFLQNDRFSGTV